MYSAEVEGAALTQAQTKRLQNLLSKCVWQQEFCSAQYMHSLKGRCKKQTMICIVLYQRELVSDQTANVSVNQCARPSNN